MNPPRVTYMTAGGSMGLQKTDDTLHAQGPDSGIISKWTV